MERGVEVGRPILNLPPTLSQHSPKQQLQNNSPLQSCMPVKTHPGPTNYNNQLRHSVGRKNTEQHYKDIKAHEAEELKLAPK